MHRAELRGPASAAWFPRIDAERDNSRAAIGIAVARGEVELRPVGRLWCLCWVRGMLTEGSERLEAALRRSDGAATLPLARALSGGAGLAFGRGDPARARELAVRAIAVAAGAPWEGNQARVVLAVAANHERDFATARRHLERGIEISEALGVEPLTEKLNLGNTISDSADPAGAVPLFEEVLGAQRRDGADEGVGFALLNRGLARLRLGDEAIAREELEEARAAFGALGFRAHHAHALQGIAVAEAREGRHEHAARLLGQARAEPDETGWNADDFDAELP